MRSLQIHPGLWWIMTLLERTIDPAFRAPRAEEHPRRGFAAVDTPRNRATTELQGQWDTSGGYSLRESWICTLTRVGMPVVSGTRMALVGRSCVQ